MNLSFIHSEYMNEKLLERRSKLNWILRPVFVVILLLVFSITVYAAWNLLSPKEVATHLEHPTLAEAFEMVCCVRIFHSFPCNGLLCNEFRLKIKYKLRKGSQCQTRTGRKHWELFCVWKGSNKTYFCNTSL